MRWRVTLAVVLLAATTSVAVAQITSATLSGTIKDETGGVLPGVDVVVRNLDTGLTRSVVTDANGYFTVSGLAPGYCTVTVMVGLLAQDVLGYRLYERIELDDGSGRLRRRVLHRLPRRRPDRSGGTGDELPGHREDARPGAQ